MSLAQRWPAAVLTRRRFWALAPRTVARGVARAHPPMIHRNLLLIIQLRRMQTLPALAPRARGSAALMASLARRIERPWAAILGHWCGDGAAFERQRHGSTPFDVKIDPANAHPFRYTTPRPSQIHAVAAYYPEHPSEEEKNAALHLVSSLALLYPCSHCRADFADYIKTNPADVSSRSAFSVWACAAHNAVNAKLGKAAFPCDADTLAQRWRAARPECSDRSDGNGANID
jgi:hypothetical protein